MADPIARLRAEREEARREGDPNANLCVLATVDGGEPQARMLVLRDVPADASGAGQRLGLFFNRSSPKFRQLAQSASQAVLVYLPSLSVQYRLRCALAEIPAEVVHRNWLQRPLVPKRQDWLYEHHPQGSALASRQQLIDLLAAECPDTAPDSALGYYLETDRVERLQVNQPDGIHDRRRFTLHDGEWREEVLMP